MFGFLFSEAACDVLKGFPSLSVISAYLGGNWYLALGKLFGKNLLCEARNTKTCLWERGKELLITRTRNQSYIHLTDVIWCTYDWSDQLMINNIQFKKPLNAQTSLCFCWWYLSTCKTISHQQSPFVILGVFMHKYARRGVDIQLLALWELLCIEATVALKESRCAACKHFNKEVLRFCWHDLMYTRRCIDFWLICVSLRDMAIAQQGVLKMRWK